METFITIIFKPEYKAKFKSITKAMMEHNKNIFIKSEPFSGVMRTLVAVATDLKYKVYEYDFIDLEEERWDDNLRNNFGMISHKENCIILFKNFVDLEERLYNFLWTTNSFSDLEASFIIVSDTNQENKSYIRRSKYINNDDFYFLLGINETFLVNRIKTLSEESYNNTLDIESIIKELNQYTDFTHN